ncbi:hypothetical protein CSKR_100826 [Clonorchis sinensis]|uniref:Glutamate-rich protein 2 n=1 Tax=Clonorchis sinensis TaxID=79923 RepID=A0A3R7DNU0_CLOSI|nr:hypothetical protein CSKR_100826 [Clonorchis sinensis]
MTYHYTRDCEASAHGDMNAEPNLDLFMEFLNCVMGQDFGQALVLCKQLMEVEPGNQVVREFLPLLSEANTMKENGYFHAETDSEDYFSESDRDEENDSTQSSSSSSESYEYSTSDSDSHGGRRKRCS